MKWFGLVLLGMAGFVSVLNWTLKGGYEVDGVPFRTWVAQHPDFNIQDPLAALGTNTVPHLVKILKRGPESERSFKAKEWIWKHTPEPVRSKVFRFRPVPDWQIKRTALFGLRSFGPEAKDALPEVIRLGRSEANRMLRAGALVAALEIAPESPDTFELWREEWHGTNFSRHDLALYLHSAGRPVPAAAPLLLAELEQNPGSVVVIEAFEFFGDGATPAVPYMIRLLDADSYTGNMLELIHRLGPVASNAAPSVAVYLNNKDPRIVASALETLQSIGPPARSQLSSIQPLISHPDGMVQMLAAAASAHIGGDPEAAVPLLLDGLEGRLRGKRNAYKRLDIRQEGFEAVTSSRTEAAAILLGELGSDANSALQALEELLGHSNAWIRISAAQAIWRISRNSEKALPVLVANLDAQPTPMPGQSSSNYEMIRTIEVIEEMGGAARDAIPSLERVRGFSMAARRAVNAALDRMEFE